jgi:hypothetical protein
LPELAFGEGALDDGELAVEREHVAAGRIRGLQQAFVDLGEPVDAAGPQGHRHLGERAIRDELSRLNRHDVVQVEHE